MIEKIKDNIFRIPVPLPNNPLKELNSYFIRGDESDLLIDVGFRLPECFDALESGLKELKSDPKRRDVLLTHLHTDHTGQVYDFVGSGRKIYMSEPDMNYLAKLLTDEVVADFYSRFISEGFPEELLNKIKESNPAFTNTMDGINAQFHGLQEGEIIKVGDYSLQTISVPGHTPGCAMFWIESHKTMFTGDNILFNITPNITLWVGVEDALGDYLDSLRKSLLYPVELALPGHRMVGDYKQRIEELLLHHERRIDEAFAIISSSPMLCSYEIAARMKWKIRATDWTSFPFIQKWFAVGECLSHLDYLRKRGKIERKKIDGIYRYSSTE